MFNLLGLGQAQPSLKTPSSADQDPLARKQPKLPSPPEWQFNPLAFRVAIDNTAAVAYGLPSAGGVLVKLVNAVDLEYLGVSRSESSRRPTTESSGSGETSRDVPSKGEISEQDWCAKLRGLAPTWYESVEDWNSLQNKWRPATAAEKISVAVGYDGLSSTKSAEQRILVLRFALREKPQDWGRYELCLNMKERCEALVLLGATVYNKEEEVDELTVRYEERMRNERRELEERYGPFPNEPLGGSDLL